MEQYRPAFRIAAGFPTIMLSLSQPPTSGQYLLQRLASHADIIMNRWKKKGHDKSKALLAETIPELHEHDGLFHAIAIRLRASWEDL